MIAGIPHSIEHQFLTRIKLEAEPVPSFLFLAQGAGRKLMVEPGEPMDGEVAIAQKEMARSFEPGKRGVITGVARSRGFAAETFLAVKDKGFERGGGEVEAKALVGIKGLKKETGVSVSAQAPFSEPSTHVLIGAFSFLEGTTADLFGKEKLPRPDIGDGQMGKVYIAHRPSGVGLAGYGLETVTEEGQFIAVGVALIVIKIAGEVPPFGFEFGMGSVIAGKRPGPGG